MSFATRIAAGGKMPVYILELEGDEVSPAEFEIETNWTAAGEAIDLTTSTTAKAGEKSISFGKQDGTVTGAPDGALAWIRSASIASHDLTDESYDRLWIDLPTITDVVAVSVALGSSDANYTRWSYPVASLAAEWNRFYLSIDEHDPAVTVTVTGTPDMSDVTWIEVRLQMSGVADTYAGMLIDKLTHHPCRYSTGPVTSPVTSTRQGWMDIPSVSASLYDPTKGTLSSATASSLVVDDDGTSAIADLDTFPPLRREGIYRMGFLGDAETDENFEPIFRGIVDMVEHKGKAWDYQLGDLLRLFRRPFAQSATKAIPYTITGNIVDVFLKLATSTGDGTNQGSFIANYDTETAAIGAGISADLFDAEIETKRDDWMSQDTCSFTFRASQPSFLEWFLKEVCLAFGVFPVVRGDGLLSLRAVEEGVYPSSDPQTLGASNIITDNLPPFALDAERVKNQVRILYDYDGVDDEFDSDTADTYRLDESIGQYGLQELPIESKGIISATVVAKVARRYLRMLGDGLPPIEVETFASQQPRIPGELVILTHPSALPDVEAGTYSIDTKLAQIEGRTFDPTSGKCRLKLGQTSYRRGPYRLIGPSGMADYDSQTAHVKATYGSISDGTSLGTDGDPEHLIGP